MKTFASVGDLAARSSVSDEIRAEALLEDATALILSKCEGEVDTDDLSEEKEALFRSVCCSIVRRVIDQGLPISQSTETVGPFSQSFTYANPTGKLYMTADEMKLLGIGKQRVGMIMPTYGVADV